MRARLTALIVLASLAAGTALAAVPPNTPTPMPAVKTKMKAVVDKTSTELFNIAGEADPANGADQKLPKPATWNKVKLDADKLKAVGDWLQDPKAGKTTEAAWMKHAKEMSALSAAASQAAAAKDAKALAQAANDLSDNCAACHKIYKKQDGA
jgi:cytochrome c556